MRFYLTTRPLNQLNEYIKISDNEIFETEGTKFYFEVTNGKITLPFFKKNIQKIESSIFYTKNIENFFLLFDFLRDEEFEIVEEKCFVSEEENFKGEIKDYLVEEFINNSGVDIMNIESIVNRLVIGDVVSYIKTSFFHPSIYLCEPTLSHRIISQLKIKDLNIKEIDLLFKGEEKETRIHLKSLLYFGAVKKRGNRFVLVI